MSSRAEPVAVIGMACRFPGGPDLASYWQLLLDGGDAIVDVPEGRWNLDALRRHNDGAPLPRSALRGGWLPRVRDFDHELFRMSPREARTLDPKQRLALEVVLEAFEDANVAPGQLRGRHDVGMFLGTAQSEYLLRFYHRMEVAGRRADRYSGPGNDPSFAAGRVAAFFGLEGPSVNVNTACSTSLVAVHQACQAIAEGACDLAAAGGVSIVESPEHSLVMDRFGVLSPEARCKAFDADADGYVRGEGCGVVILRRLSHALAAGDRIYAVLAGSAVNSNGPSDNLMAPSGRAQERLLRRTLAVAGVAPDQVDVVEAHGTGTKAGDPVEIGALAAVFGAAHDAARPLLVASVKGNIGHLEVTAGVAGLIKAALAVHHGVVPRHRNLVRLNPAIDPALPFAYPRDTTPWPAAGHPRRAVVNSFGISGINAAVLVEQAPAPRPVLPEAPPRPLTVLPLSAAGAAPLAELSRRYADRLAQTPLVDVAFTAATGRDAHPARLAVVAARPDEAADALRAAATGATHPALRRGEARSAPRIAWLFTGQGAQHLGMGRDLVGHEPVFREALDEVDAALRPHLGRSIRDVMLGDDREVDLGHTAWTQPALFALEVALAALWRSFGVVPEVVAGHSIGEIAAAHVAGVFSLDDAARLVAARGRLMGELPAGGAMAAVLAGVDAVRDTLTAHPAVDLAADNGPRAVVLSGPAPAVTAACRDLEARGVATRPLDVSHAFHSALMDPMLDAFREVVGGLRLQPARVPVVSNLTGALAREELADPAYWVRHVREPVRFREAVLTLAAHGVDTLLEVGPRGTLVGMGRRCRPGWDAAWLASLDPQAPHATLLGALAELWVRGATPDWHGVWARHPARRVDLPRYPFQRREHWVDDPGPPVPGPAAAPQAVPPPPGEGPAFYRSRWLPTPDLQGDPVPVGTWIVGVDRAGVGQRIADALAADGHRVVRAAHDASALGADVVVDPTRPEAFRELVARFRSDLRGWVHAWSLDAPAGDELPAAALVAGQDPASVASLHIAQALLAERPDGAGLWTVTRGADAVHPGEAAAPGQACAWGVARVLALEHRALPNVRVDLDPRGAGDDGLLALLRRPPHREDQLAIRRGAVYALRLVPHTPTGATLRPLPGSSWLITGGLGALGLATAEALATAGATHLVLCGRSAPSPEARAAVARLEAAGVRVRVEAADVARPDDVARLVRAADALAPLRGVVHAAGVLADGPVLQQDRARFLQVFPAKVEGAWNLHRATRDHDLDAFVLFSSVTASLGAPGQVNYAAANAFLDALAARRRADGLPAVAIDWGPWAEIGMAAGLTALMAARGMGGVPPREGTDALIRAGADVVPQVAFMDLRLDRLLAQEPAVAEAPLLRELVGERASAAALPPPLRAPAAPPPVAVDGVVARLAAAPDGARPDLLRDALAAWAEELLGLTPGELDPGRPLAWSGFDSVLALDLQRRVADELGVELPLDALVHGPKPAEVVEVLLPRLDLSRAQAAPPTPQAAAPAPAPAPPLPVAPPTPVLPVAAAPAPPRAALLDRLAAWSEELLGLTPGELDPRRPLAWVGFDSVMAVDLQRRIHQELDVDLPLDRVVHGPRLDELADVLLPLVDASRLTPPAEAPAAPPSAAPSPSPPPPPPDAPTPARPTSAPRPVLWALGALLAAGLGWAAWQLLDDDDGGAAGREDTVEQTDDRPRQKGRKRRNR